MKPRSPIPRVSLKRASQNKGKPQWSTITAPRKAIRKVNPIAKAKRDKRYKSHLSSAYWKALRKKVWARMADVPGMGIGIVKLCESPDCEAWIVGMENMQCGHLTYVRFGKELESDVQGQCKNCNQTEAALRGKRIWHRKVS